MAMEAKMKKIITTNIENVIEQIALHTYFGRYEQAEALRDFFSGSLGILENSKIEQRVDAFTKLAERLIKKEEK
jgi:hypothetical protein